MISSTHRFHGRSSLRYVYQHGTQIRGDLVSLRAVRNKRQKTWRVAIAVSRKVNKSAVVRNRIRRRIFEVVRHHTALIKEPYDLVFSVYSDQAANLDQQSLEKAIVDRLSKIESLTKAKSYSNHAIVDNKETK